MYSLATVLMSKRFGGRPSCVAHLPHAPHVQIQETICRELKQRDAYAADQAPDVDDGNVNGADAADHEPAADDGNVNGTDVADYAPAGDDGNVEGADAADHAPNVNDGNIEGIDTADHAPAVDGGNAVGTDAADHTPIGDDGNVEGTNAADRTPAVDDGSVEVTDAGPNSTPCISGEGKGKGVWPPHAGWIAIDGSSDETFHPYISPKTNTTIHSKSQTAGDDGSEYTVPESSFNDDGDDEATDQKVLAGMSTQTDLSPAFDIPVTALLPVVPFVHHVVSCQLDPAR
ncbi:hypothetical protein BU17DRAFT_69928 [Hysterangium stoloniferum]|nr:hypothetical protein BU17DRAFT_69928 [Hysterangium stoloniferum]